MPWSRAANGVGIYLAAIVCMPRVAYTAEVTLRARQSADEIARLLDELLGDRSEQWTLVIRESFEDPDLRIDLRREQGEVASFDFRFHGDADAAVDPVLEHFRGELHRAGVVTAERPRAGPPTVGGINTRSGVG